MLLVTDVQYDNDNGTALSAGVLFRAWGDAVPAREITVPMDDIEPYVPGQFWKREVPCLTALLGMLPQREWPHEIIVDGHTWLGTDRPGMGHYLWEALGQTIPVIGVAKTRFHTSHEVAIEVRRGGSKKPLYVTTVGTDPQAAAAQVEQMHGPYRIPTLFKRVDGLARGQKALVSL